MTKESIRIFGAHAEARKEFHLSPYIERRSSIVRAEKRIISYTTEFTRSTQADLEIAQDNKFMIIWMSTRTEIYHNNGMDSTRFMLLNENL